MRSIEFSGKSVDEAVFLGLQQMGLGIDAVDIEIIQNESKGVFGIGGKPAIVRLTEKPLESIMEETNILTGEPQTEAVRQEPSRSKSDRSPSRKQPKKDHSGSRSNREVRSNRQPREAAPAKPAIAYSKELAQSLPAATFLSGLLERMGVDAEVLAAEHDDALRLRIDSNSMGILIGHRGETLDAMQYLTSLVINRTRKDGSYQRVTIDTEDYRDKREETLKRLARRLASQVRSSGKPHALEPMNPYERRILHAALQHNPHVTTYSEGEEPNRRVVISPKR